MKHIKQLIDLALGQAGLEQQYAVEAQKELKKVKELLKDALGFIEYLAEHIDADQEEIDLARERKKFLESK